MANTDNLRLSILDPKETIAGGKTKLDARKKGLRESTVRKRLADISNLPRQCKSAIEVEKSQILLNTDKVYIDKLQKENTSLLELLADKNKIIEMNELELKKMNMNMQKVQQLNIQFAQANGLMLTELNAGRERLKAMQHELGCTKSLLRIKDMELEEKLKVRISQEGQNQAMTNKSQEGVLETTEEVRDQANYCNNRNRDQESQGLDHSSVQNEKLNEKTEGKSRVCLDTEPAQCQPGETGNKAEGMVSAKENPEKKRGGPRKSAIFKLEEPKSKEEETIEMTDTARSSECSSLNDKEGSIDQVPRRPSIARPSRLAAKKVQSYKEIPVNVKMRRPE